MKQVLFLLGILFFILSSCKDKTSINGIVINSKTGHPVEGAQVHITYDYTDHGSRLSNTKHKKTDASGQFHFSATDVFSVGVDYVEKSGYVMRRGADSPIVDGEENNVEIKLRPKDGVLKLNIINTQGVNDSIFVAIINKCEYIPYWYGGFHRLDEYPLFLAKGENYETVFLTCQEEITYIEWGFEKPPTSTLVRDSILIVANDTTFYTIEY